MSDIPNQSGINPSDESDHNAASGPTCSGKGPLIAAFSIGLLLVGGMAFSLYWFLGGSSAKVDAEMLSYLPADSQIIAGADLEELVKNSRLKELVGKLGDKEDPLKEANEKLKPTSLTVDDFSSIVMGATPGSGEQTVVFRTKKAFDKAKMAEAMGIKEEKKKGDKTYYATPREVLYFPSDTLMVITSEKQFETIAGRNSAKVLISEELQDFVRKIGKGNIWIAIARGAIPGDELKQIELVKGMGLPYLSADLIDAAKEAKGAGLSLKFDGDQVTIAGTLLCADKSAAKKAAAALSKDIDERRGKELADDAKFGAFSKMLPPEAQKTAEDVKKSLKSDQSGSYLTVSAEVRLDDASKLLKGYIDYQKRQFEAQMRQFEADMNRKFEQQFKAQDNKVGPNLEKLTPPTKE